MTQEEMDAIAAKKAIDDAYDQELLKALLWVRSGTGGQPSIQELFRVYNRAFDPKESCVNCAVARVLSRSAAHLQAKGLLP